MLMLPMSAAMLQAEKNGTSCLKSFLLSGRAFTRTEEERRQRMEKHVAFCLLRISPFLLSVCKRAAILCRRLISCRSTSKGKLQLGSALLLLDDPGKPKSKRCSRADVTRATCDSLHRNHTTTTTTESTATSSGNGR